ncbi:M48 family metalloprotease [Azospirillum doebereinerae]|uniref:Tetratricopeptide repeat protein n=1 Tax=Azospirillum doebereinerae TaxID=92933 RepID=A0A3S0WP61_9PROT|nr:M48 family metalloprotease [Azospirillum doebereinerae]MCG5239982.1 M48 family metalloprotease [Azospirillum doebereinerae]RUQ75017.1 tetratricopeptide repeat protein [Azospirillum doebereinerae]
MRKPSRLVSVVAIVSVFVMSLVWGAPPASAQRRPEMQILSDAETDHIIRKMARPIFQAAGIDPDSVTILLVNDASLNAFVAGGQNIFLHTGLIQSIDDVGQLLGVIAHETGHISGGHLVRGADAMENAFLSSLIGMGLGIVGGIASRNAGAGAAGVMLGQHLAERNLLSFSRSQEASADQAGLSFLEQSGMSAMGMLTFLQKLGVGDPLLNDRDAGYRLTHPLTRERIASVQAFVDHSRFANTPTPAAVNEDFRRIQAKLNGYLDPAGALRRYRADDRSAVARYGRAYAYFRRGDVKQATPLVDGLIAEDPRNPYLHEMKGDLALQTGRAPDAVAPYRKAVELAGSEAGSIRVSLAHALLEQHEPRLADEALKNLQIAAKTQAQSAFLWRLTAQAWSMKDNPGMLAYATAEEALARGDLPMAKFNAERAEKLLPAGSPGWIRSQDIRGQTGGRDAPK